MNEFFLDVANFFGLAWWVEVVTETPRCTYYFGPFGRRLDAEAMQRGYVEDLRSEGAGSIVATVKRCKPQQLTIVEDEVERAQLEAIFTRPQHQASA